MTIKKIIEDAKKFSDKEIEIKAWVSANRGNKKIRFIEINDGSTIDNLQVIVKGEKFDFQELDRINLGASLLIRGTLKYTPEAQQKVELSAQKIEVLSNTDSSYPIQKKEINLETLRDLPHVRHRTNVLRATMIIRSALAYEIHQYFHKHGFLNFSAPIITSNDGEGAGETFFINDSNSDKPFFGNQNATLGVTGQLHAESYALGFNKVYTFAPTFRAEHSNTKKHAAEFWMIEPEIAFYTLKDVIELADDLLKKVIQNVMKKYASEFNYLKENVDNNLLTKLDNFVNSKINILDYQEALKILEKHKDEFEEKNIRFGLDFKTEHERFLAEKIYNAPVAVINFPKEFKAFYMHQNEDEKTVASFDLLVPGIGELIGGSQRENNIEKLKKRIQELNINQKDLQWYLDLRKFGNAGSSGFGIGFERLVMYVTGIDNIRDVIPYPRTSGNIKM